MPIRVECSTPGLETNWIAVDDVWTRRELGEYLTAKDDAFMAIWLRKVVGCQVATAAGEVLTDPAELMARRDDLDLRLVRFLTAAVLEATDHLLTLGEANKRLSLPGGDIAAKTTLPPVKTNRAA